ncbi:DUF948 domain-containing protein [Neobacillus notoginsengisoli]|uniref:DUF948 domain-containing protein n=1 Tax=Neobacillus notoginsengisoli TaxID=1578198 RepID=A0A417YRZ8_9BACI|nr:DUF948 domain-containing protein [Neobacillus notoginsengisoli]RHW38074.1 DUF948 domain-containing protein [Neobacillus notoginsengisoli]
MILVYVSIAVIVISLGYFGFVAFKTIKAAKPAINQLNETVARVQRKADTLKVESVQLTECQQELVEDINDKKQAVSFTVNAAKRTAKTLAKLWKIRPMAKLARKKKTRTLAY